MNEKNVSVIRTNTFSYLDTELIDKAVRRSVELLGLPDNFIQEGFNVLIKPNLVMDKNGLAEEGIECLYTQAAMVKPVIDYVLEKTNGNVNIVIGDAPMQECVFDNLVGYKELVTYYHEKGIDIKLVDFRELTSEIIKDVHVQSINKEAKGKVINLGEFSEFYGENEHTLKKMRVTNYDPRILPKHHHGKVHEYYISQYILDADLIINMPKPKTHRKAGVTGALKNLVGANTRKEFLPHHTLGAKENGGDEYKVSNPIHRLRSSLYDVKNVQAARGRITEAQMVGGLINICSAFLKLGRNEYAEGSWYGNDTISRTIVDLNRIVKYSDKKGNICTEPQRKMLIIGDMVISGEKEGPVYPTAKKVGLIVSSTNSVYFDEAVISIMGFDSSKFPTMVRAWGATCFLPLIEKKDIPVVLGDYDLETIPNLRFQPTSGWRNHIEKEC